MCCHVICYYMYFMFLEVNTVVFMYHRITLEDDDEDEDLGLEPAVKRPVLVILDSLKEGLQRGITDILPHTVAQSMYVIVRVYHLVCLSGEFPPLQFFWGFFFPRSQSCMELVLWRPPDDLFSQKQKSSAQKLRKQQPAVSQQPLTPCSSPNHQSPSSPPAVTHSCLYSFPVARSSAEEDMEM